MQVDLYNGRKTVVVVTAVIMVSIVSMHTIRYEYVVDAILTCARKPT